MIAVSGIQIVVCDVEEGEGQTIVWGEEDKANRPLPAMFKPIWHLSIWMHIVPPSLPSELLVSLEEQISMTHEV